MSPESIMRRMRKNKATQEEEDSIELQADLIDDAIDRGSRGLGINLKNQVGLCAECNNYRYAENDMHMIVMSECCGFGWDTPKVITGRQKIRNCSQYKAKGEMDINTMIEIAHIIDLDNPMTTRKKAGFTSEELKDHDKTKSKG